jgi:hypothetical protein
MGDTQVILDSNDVTWSSYPYAPAAKCVYYNPNEAGVLKTHFHIVLGKQVAWQYTGRFRCFVRYRLWSADTWMQLRFSSQSLSSPLYYDTPLVQLYSGVDGSLADFGVVTLPVTGEGEIAPPQNIFIAVKMMTDALVPYNNNVYVQDIILMPVDEWFGDFSDNVAGYPLGVGTPTFSAAVLSVVDVNSTGAPRRSIVSSLRWAQDETLRANYAAIVAGPMILQANACQRLWFLTMQYDTYYGVFYASPFGAASVRVRKVERYASMRGAR